MKIKTKTKNTILATIVSVVAISLPSLILNKWIEGAFFYLCHWLIRPQFPKEYHHIIPATCRVITGTIFFFGVSLILPVSLSIISAIPINYLISWVGFTKKQADYYEVKYNRLYNKYCNEKEELLLKCRKAKLSKRDTEIAIKYFYEKQTPKDIWIWILENQEYESIEWDTVYFLIWKIGKKLKEN